MAAPNVNISVETIHENQIQEVTLDGQEIYSIQLSMSEQLAKSADKIDFYKDESEEKGKLTSEGEKNAPQDNEVVKFQPSLWPWDSVRNKLKAAYTEMVVLCDVLKIAKEKRYMMLDHMAVDNPDGKPSIHLVSKKKALSAGASVLLSGAERIRNLQREASTHTVADFHTELMKLRQNWRLRKVGQTILGDLSYKSTGSRYYQGGTFEVIKCDEGSSTTNEDSNTPNKCTLRVTVPSELQGVAYIQVEVKSIPECTDIASSFLQNPSRIGDHWQQKLEAAQNVLFCKELFAQLAREAVQSRSSTPRVVVGNQIFTNIFPGIQLSIVLCHYTGKDKKTPTQSQTLDHNHVLEHSLHQLLREFHHKTSYIPTPHPTTAMLGMSKKRCVAGPRAFSAQELVEISDDKGLLEQIVCQTKHTVLRKRTMDTIDQLSKQYSDLQIYANWCSLNSSIEASVKVIISYIGYESIRTSLVVVVGVDNIKVIGRDGRVCSLSYEQRELHDWLLWQIQQHHIVTVHSMSKMMGWQSISSSLSSGVGPLEINGTKASIMLASPYGNKVLSLTSGATSGVMIAVKTLPHDADRPIVSDEKWNNLGGPFVPIDFDKLEGHNFANKLELLVACLVKEK